MMGRHKADHIQVAYGKDVVTSDTALMAKAAAFRELGFEVYLCGCKVENNYKPFAFNFAA
jgi:hypothetical protein